MPIISALSAPQRIIPYLFREHNNDINDKVIGR
jgi:hypothetical protein